jgi:hypothetical protein
MNRIDETGRRSSRISKDQIKDLLESLGRTLSAGDTAAASKCFDVPSLMLGPEIAIAFASTREIAELLKNAADPYKARGIVATRPEIKRVEALGEDLAAVDVRWPGVDEAGAEKSSELSHYILQLGPDGHPRIRVALTRTIAE